MLHPRLARMVPWALPVGFLLTGLLYVHALMPGVVLPGARDPTSQMRGWAAFAQDIEAVRRAQGAAWIATGDFGMTGQLAWQLDAGVPVVQLTERLRYVHLPPPDPALLQRSALFVTLARNDRVDWLATRFRSVREVAVPARSHRGVILAEHRAWLVADPIVPVLDPLDAVPLR